MNTFSYTLALIMGFTGSLHCAGMCGPIVWVMPFQAYNGIKKAVALGLYHVGRISVYALMAVTLHSFRSIFQPQVQQYLSITLGVLLLVGGLLTFMPTGRLKIHLPWEGLVRNKLGHVMAHRGMGMLFVAGTLNGLLPCGLVYMALSATMAAPSALVAAGMMYVFGVGTLPMLVSITLLKTQLVSSLRVNARRFVPVLVFSFGCLFILRGMNLGIPYLSPKVAVEQHGIKSCCCHRK